MTEKEKRDLGLLYNANYDKQLLEELAACKDKCFYYNQIKPSDFDKKVLLLSDILGSVGSIMELQAPFFCDYGYNISVGKNFYANHGLVILDGAKVEFGDNVFIGPNCGFHTAGHPIDATRRNRGLEYCYPINVGSDVWIGAGVQVMPGVTIGSNVVIGSGSIVTKDIESNSVAVGNPCKVVRTITKDDEQKEYEIA